MKIIFLLTLFIQFGFISYGQCETFTISEIGAEPAKCRTSSIQSGNGIVYVSATGGSPDYSYLWTNLVTGATSNNTTWGGLNVGDYQIQITDQLGCILIDTIEVDSINPIADFSITSSDLDGTLTGNAPVSVEVNNTSSNVFWMGDPMSDDPIHWKLGDTAAYFTTYSAYAPQYATFNSESVQEICLAIENSNGCTDTICKYITVNGYASTDELKTNGLNIYTYQSYNTQILTFVLGNPSNGSIKLYNLDGKVVKIIYEGLLNEGQNSFDVDLQSVAPGVYIYSVQLDDGRSWELKTIKQ